MTLLATTSQYLHSKLLIVMLSSIIGTASNPALWKILIPGLSVTLLLLYVTSPASIRPVGSDENSLRVMTKENSRESTSLRQRKLDCPHQSMPLTQAKCIKPVKRVCFIKTHKTASTTLASIIERYGYTRNLSFALGNTDHVLADQDLFTRDVVNKSPPSKHRDGSYDMLTNHARYNRPEMDAVVPGAVYVTILRNPVKQWESAFSYFEMPKTLNLTGRFSNPLEEFMKTPQKYIDQKYFFWWQAKNGQIFDLGLDHKYHHDRFSVDYKIRQLESEMDLVLITEYLDESLLLLKKLLCWDMNDILYISNNIRKKSLRYTITGSVRRKILEWNKVDVKLYQHFKQVLEQKIQNYGPRFTEDLKEFRQARKAIMNKCVEPRKRSNKSNMETRYVLRKNSSELCKNLWRGDKTFTTLLREKQLGRIL